jgi:hypothetical protein
MGRCIGVWLYLRRSRWYSKTLQLLNPDDRVWVRVPGLGVGIGSDSGTVEYSKAECPREGSLR